MRGLPPHNERGAARGYGVRGVAVMLWEAGEVAQ